MGADDPGDDAERREVRELGGHDEQDRQSRQCAPLDRRHVVTDHLGTPAQSNLVKAIVAHLAYLA